MQVGDVIKFRPFALRYAKGAELNAPFMPGTVVWVHPQGRFAVVERRTGFYTYRECVPVNRTMRKEVQSCENDSNYELEGRRGQNRNCPHFGRRAAPRREDFCAR